MPERNFDIRIGAVKPGNTVWYGSLRRDRLTELLVGVVGFYKKSDQKVEVIVTREGRMGKVSLDAEHPVSDLGVPKEFIPEYRLVVPGVR